MFKSSVSVSKASEKTDSDVTKETHSCFIFSLLRRCILLDCGLWANKGISPSLAREAKLRRLISDFHRILVFHANLSV